MRFGKVSPSVFYGVLCIGFAAAVVSFAAAFAYMDKEDSDTADALAITAAALVLFNQFIISCMIKHVARRGIFTCKTIFCLVASEASAAVTVSLISVGVNCKTTCHNFRGEIFIVGGIFALKALGTGLFCYHLMTLNLNFENDEDKNNDNVKIAKATVVEAVHHVDKVDQIL